MGAPVFARLCCFCCSASDGDLDRLRFPSVVADVSGIFFWIVRKIGKSKKFQELFMSLFHKTRARRLGELDDGRLSFWDWDGKCGGKGARMMERCTRN